MTLGGCPEEKRARMYSLQNTTIENICLDPLSGLLADSPNLGPMSPNYTCTGDRMESLTMWLGDYFWAVIQMTLCGTTVGVTRYAPTHTVNQAESLVVVLSQNTDVDA